jgi:hypothetical protein
MLAIQIQRELAALRGTSRSYQLASTTKHKQRNRPCMPWGHGRRRRRTQARGTTDLQNHRHYHVPCARRHEGRVFP